MKNFRSVSHNDFCLSRNYSIVGPSSFRVKNILARSHEECSEKKSLIWQKFKMATVRSILLRNPIMTYFRKLSDHSSSSHVI